MKSRFSPAVVLFSACATLAATSCAKKAELEGSCVKEALLEGIGSQGVAKAFLPDPIASSNNPNLPATSLKLDEFRQDVALEHLGGRGVLEGSYAYVVNGNACDGGFGAFDPKNDFTYKHSDFRFQEAMTYHLATSYRAFLDQASYLQPTEPLKIVTHCGYQDNAFFMRLQDGSGIVCLGDSVTTPGASYSDDGVVAIHELQHATTVDTYSRDPDVFLSPFYYDEGGSLNEAVSDFMALMFTSPMLAGTSLDPLVFSRWALQTFTPNHSGIRGAHRCPTYDPTYPACGNYPAFSGKGNTISYKYPEGLGWPYSNNFSGPEYAVSAFKRYSSQEEIHNAGVLLAGALWDVHDGIKRAGDSSEERARVLSAQLVMEGIRQLPKPTLSTLAPVNFRSFASSLVTAASMLDFSSNERAAIETALTDRGLLGGNLLGSDWAAIGPGDYGTGIRVLDNPGILGEWLGDSRLVPQGIDTGLNAKLDPGEVAVLWFDLRNTKAETAGAVEVTVRSLDPSLVTLKDPARKFSYNVGYLSDTEAQILYGKVNGSAVVSGLNDATPGSAQESYNVPTGNTYFKTNPYFDRTYRTGIWVHVSKNAAPGATVSFEVTALPSNSTGAPAVLTFTTQIAQ